MHGWLGRIQLSWKKGGLAFMNLMGRSFQGLIIKTSSQKLVGYAQVHPRHLHPHLHLLHLPFCQVAKFSGLEWNLVLFAMHNARGTIPPPTHLTHVAHKPLLIHLFLYQPSLFLKTPHHLASCFYQSGTPFLTMFISFSYSAWNLYNSWIWKWKSFLIMTNIFIYMDLVFFKLGFGSTSHLSD